MKRRGKVVGIVGLWLIAAAVAGLIPLHQIWSNAFVGVVVVVLGNSIGMTYPARGFLSTISGIWILIATVFPMLLVAPGLLVNNIVTGLVLACTGFSVPSGSEEDIIEMKRAA